MIKPIHTEADYKAALKAVNRFFEHEPDPGTPEADEFDVMVTLIESYEAKNFPIGLPDPIEAIKFRMEQGGLTVDDLKPAIGEKNRVYEVLKKRRPLTLMMIRRLNILFDIPADVLIKQYDPDISSYKAIGKAKMRPAGHTERGHTVRLSSGRRS